MASKYLRTDYRGVVLVDATGCVTGTDGNPLVVELADGGVAAAPTADPMANVKSATLKASNTANATNVKNSSGYVEDILASNNSAANKWLKFYDKASNPVAADTPIATILIEPGTTLSVTLSLALKFANGISYAITSGVSTFDVTSPDDVTGFFTYV